ncbi:hypothetical protein G4V62_03255 [Bacillaceae bacterium SIJ1]|uniref:hypothetical protein n=1 Tax=Litoribacterium kuwaitense TaxID=1398745 RepID=UPI0013ED9FB5|nr:hypothetical protein [Litoribacterium kuwaitense]NGP44013.1 hypothetical protein [Litoribacterium kuwaitense]
MDSPMKSLEDLLMSHATKTEKKLISLAEELESKDEVFVEFAEKINQETGVHVGEFFKKRHGHQLDGLSSALSFLDNE